ncbi:MAG: hypothetical protein MUF48_19850 [Pirellulaceae bacterium]|nr:hypothetical protein [Pirellulaceae bacterium]
MSDTNRRQFVQATVASLAAASLFPRALATERASPDDPALTVALPCGEAVAAPWTGSPLKLSFRIGSAQWLSDAQWRKLLDLLGAQRPACDELSLFTHEAMGWFGTVDEMTRDAELMARRIREAHAAGFRSVGINVLCTMGHGDPVGEWSPEFVLPPAVGHNGQQSTHCPCPNSVPFREHIQAKYQLFAQAKPDFLWVDDDVRATHHGVTYPCFCPLCLATFGRGSDRAELVRRLNDPAEHELRRAWVEFNATTIESLCRDINAAVRAVDPNIALGLMTIGSSHSTYGGHALDRWTAALQAVKGRPGHGFYSDETPRGIFHKALDVGRQVRDYSPSVTEIQYELENYPYVALDKADRTVLNEVYLALMMGCNGAAFNALKGAATGTLDDYQGLVAAIAAERPAWEALVDHVADLPAVGYWPADDNALMGKRGVDASGWFWEGGVYNIHQPNALVEMGIPLTPIRSASCGTLLAGKIAEAFSDAELQSRLSRGVLMDTCTLEVLWARGLGEFTGVRPGKRVLGGAVETLTAHALNGRFQGDHRDALIESTDNVRVLELVQPGAAELARLTGYDDRDHGCCLSVYENALGGRVAVSSYVPWRRLGSLCKRSQLTELADWLAYQKMPVRIEAFRRVAPFVRMSADGQRYAIVLLNATLDHAQPFELRVRAAARNAVLQSRDGTVPLAVTPGSGEVCVTVPQLPPWQPAVILGS